MWVPLRILAQYRSCSFNSFDRCINYAAVSVSQGAGLLSSRSSPRGRSRGPIDIGGIPVGEFPYESPTMRITKHRTGALVDLNNGAVQVEWSFVFGHCDQYRRQVQEQGHGP